MPTDSDQRVWYYRFKQSKDTPEDPYLTRYSQPTCILAKMMKGDKGPYYMFTSFENWQQRQLYSDTHPELSLFEYMPEYVKERKIYFDIDHEVPTQEKDRWVEPHRTHLGHVVKKLYQLFTMYGLPFGPEDIRIYHSCGEKGTMFKYSFHVVVVTYVCSTPEHVSYICKEVREYVEAAMPLSVEAKKDNGEPVKSWIDKAPYNKSQQFRLYGSAKPGSNRKKVLLQDNGCGPHQYTYYWDGKPCHHNLPDYSGVFLGGCNPLHLESLVATTPIFPRSNHVLPTSFCPVPRKEVKEGENVTLEQTEGALDAAIVQWPFLEGQYETGSSDEDNKLVRRTPGRCPQCDTEHENENAYINRYADGSVWFMCLRARKNLRIANYTAVNGPDMNEDHVGVGGNGGPRPPTPQSSEFENYDSDSESESEEVEEEPEEAKQTVFPDVTWAAPIDYVDRGLNNPCARVAYRERWGISDRSSVKAITSFSRILPHSICPRGGVDSTDDDAVLTAMEATVHLAGHISQHYKLRDGTLTIFARMKETKKDPIINIVYYLPSTKKNVTVGLNISTILQGDFIYDHTFPPSDPKEDVMSDPRRAAAKALHNEHLCVMPEDPCYTPYFRDTPAPLLTRNNVPSPKTMNVSNGFSCNPARYMWTSNGMGGSRRITVAEFEGHPLIAPLVTLCKYGMCKGDQKEHKNTMNWTAHPLAHPEDSRTKKAVVNYGDEGVGKSIWGDVTKKFYGNLYYKPAEGDVMGKFNRAIEGKLFIQLDEPEQSAPSQKSSGMSTSSKIAKMKDRITCKHHSIRRMREDPYEVPALENYYITSNFCDIDFINVDDKRRYLVLNSRCIGYDVTLQRYVYSLKSGLTDDLEDEMGNPLDITFDKKRGEAAKIFFYSNILGPAIDHADFGDIFAAYLLAWANENDTYAIREVIQDSHCEVRQKLRESMRTPTALLIDDLRGERYIPLTKITIKSITRQKLQCDDSENMYYVSYDDLHQEYQEWFNKKYPKRTPRSLPEFSAECRTYAASSQGKAEDVSGNKRPDLNGRKVLAGLCFVSATPFCHPVGATPTFGSPPVSQSAAPVFDAEAAFKAMQVQMQKYQEESAVKDAEIKALRAALNK